MLLRRARKACCVRAPGRKLARVRTPAVSAPDRLVALRPRTSFLPNDVSRPADMTADSIAGPAMASCRAQVVPRPRGGDATSLASVFHEGVGSVLTAAWVAAKVRVRIWVRRLPG